MVKLWIKNMAYFIGFENRTSVSSINCLKNDFNCRILIDAQTMLSPKSRNTYE